MISKELLIKRNVSSFFDYVGSGTNHDNYISEKYSWILSKAESQVSDIFPNNLIYKVFISDHREINELIEKVKQQELPNRVWIEKTNQWVESFKENGYEKIMEFPAMFLKISEMKNPTTKCNDSNVEIKLVDNEDLLYEWAKLIVESWWLGGPDQIDRLCKLYKEFYQDTDRFKMYLAFYDGVPVGTSMSVFSDNTVGLYLISTHPDYRNRGIGKLLTKMPILEAKKEGYEYAILQATEMGEVVYKQVGFEEVFKYVVYAYRYDI